MFCYSKCCIVGVHTVGIAIACVAIVDVAIVTGVDVAGITIVGDTRTCVAITIASVVFLYDGFCRYC